MKERVGRGRRGGSNDEGVTGRGHWGGRGGQQGGGDGEGETGRGRRGERDRKGGWVGGQRGGGNGEGGERGGQAHKMPGWNEVNSFF